MAETKAAAKFSVLTVAGFLGMVSFATGFAAEVTRVKASQVQITSYAGCIYPSSPATALGLVAAVALLIAQITINVSAGCGCCKRSSSHPSNSSPTKHVVFCVFSWITFVAASVLLLAGAALNNGHGINGESSYSGYYSCYVVKPGVFAGGAVLSILTVIFGIIYYLTLISGNSSIMMINNDQSGNPSATNYQGGQAGEMAIAMGQPQFPPKSTQEPAGP